MIIVLLFDFISSLIRAETDGGVIRGTLFGENKKYKKGRCVYCKKETEQVVYVAKRYRDDKRY